MFKFWCCQTCRFRFPAAPTDLPSEACPHCNGVIEVVAQIEESPAVSPHISTPPPKQDIVAILDNIRSANNVGTIIRTADGAGLKHVYLCGMTAPATNRKVIKTALDAEKAMPSTHYLNVMDAIEEVRQLGYQVWAVEGGENAAGLFDCRPAGQKIALVMGNEKAGVDPDILAIADQIVSLPMRGVKQSLNVAVAFGVACYYLVDGT